MKLSSSFLLACYALQFMRVAKAHLPDEHFHITQRELHDSLHTRQDVLDSITTRELVEELENRLERRKGGGGGAGHGHSAGHSSRSSGVGKSRSSLTEAMEKATQHVHDER